MRDAMLLVPNVIQMAHQRNAVGKLAKGIASPCAKNKTPISILFASNHSSHSESINMISDFCLLENAPCSMNNVHLIFLNLLAIEG